MSTSRTTGAAIGSAKLRTAMGHFATGVTIVTARGGAPGEPAGGTANAVASVSLEPPLLLVCLQRGSRTLAALQQTGCFALNVLGDRHEQIARRFADSGPGNRFDGVPWYPGASGVPLLHEGIAALECTIHDVADGGDHAVVIGRVRSVSFPDRQSEPLVFFRGRFRRLQR